MIQHMRALYPETTYFLNNDYEDVYEWNGKWVGIRKAREADPTPIDFFAIPSQKDGNRCCTCRGIRIS